MQYQNAKYLLSHHNLQHELLTQHSFELQNDSLGCFAEHLSFHRKVEGE